MPSWQTSIHRLAPMMGRASLLVALASVPLLAYWMRWPLCAAKSLFGVPCPGCGLTRATLALMMLEPGRALAFHPLVVLAVPLIGWASLHFIRGGEQAAAARLPSWLVLGGFALLTAVWAIRLAGGLGGLPDPVDPAQGTITQLWYPGR
jgi:hypothetical protein